MKNKNIISAIFMAVLMLFNAVAFTACQQEEPNTEQFTGELTLLAYGPSPVARGGILRFIGKGMDQIATVTLAGCEPISEIEHVSATEIRITVPQSAEPCYPILTTAKGKELIAETRLTYTEPVGFAEEEAIVPNPVKPGTELTINGTYLNLVQTIIFANKVEVKMDKFTEHKREVIKFIVPEEALSGKFLISFVATEDSIPNEIMSNEALEIVVPSVEEIAKLDDKKPGDAVTIKGKDFDLINAIVSPTGDTIEFTLNDEKTEVSFEMPKNITDGGIFALTKSDVRVAIATVNVALPKEIVLTPAADLRPSDVITITGKNLELVTNVSFPNGSEHPTVVALEEGGTAEAITVKLPDAAITGKLVLNTAANIGVEAEFVTKKPAVTLTPAVAGTLYELVGTDLDLIAKLTFEKGLVVERAGFEKDATATKIVVKVPITTGLGDLVATMNNGEVVNFGRLEVTPPAFCYVTAWPEDDVLAGSACALEVANGDVLEQVLLNDTPISHMFVSGKLFIGLPDDAKKKNTLKFVSSNGEVEYSFVIKPNSEVTTVLWTGMAVAEGFQNQPFLVDPQAWIDAEIAVGDMISVYITTTADNWALEIIDGHWDNHAKQGHLADANNAANPNYDLEAHGGHVDFIVTAQMMEEFDEIKEASWGGMIIANGDKVIVTKVTTTHFVSLEETLAEGPIVADGWGNQPTVLANGELDEAKAGQILRIYVDYTPGWIVQIYDPGWVGQIVEYKEENYDLAEHDGAIEIVLTDDFLNKVKGGMVFNGDKFHVSSITLE